MKRQVMATVFVALSLWLLLPGEVAALCLFDSDCASTQYCSLPELQCKARGGSRSSCTGFGQGTCQSGLVCDVLGECRHAPPQSGELCAFLDPNSCSGGASGNLACSASGRCATRGGSRAACTGLGQGTCQSALVCDVLGECRHEPAQLDEVCGAGVSCIASLGCSADVGGRCLARGAAGQSCSGVGQGSCQSSLVCNALPRVCRHDPPIDGEGCSVALACQAGLACIADVCRQPRKAGEGCLLSSECQGGLDCRPCFTASCQAPFQCFPQSGHEIFPSDLCLSLYSPAVHSLAINTLNLTLSIGAGSAASVVAGASDEVGVVYGNDGSYGCYLSLCAGAGTSVGISDFVALGFSSSYGAFAGESLSVVESVGVGEGVSLSFSTSQIFTQGGLFNPAALVGTQDSLSIGIGASLPLSGAIFQCSTIVDTVKTLAPAGVPVTPIPGGVPKPPVTLAAAVLPASRSVQIGTPATAFATIINLATTAASGCAPALETPLPNATFRYQTTDPATNTLIGSANAPASIPAGGSRSFVIAITPTAALSVTDVRFRFACTGTDAAPVTPGLNTLLLSASASPTPDAVALVATLQNDGIVHVPGVGTTGVFSVATVNVGGSSTVTASVDTGALTLPLDVTICETDAHTGVCLGAPAATATRAMAAGATSTFGVFVRAFGPVAFSPATKRLVIRLRDIGNIVRGAASVAVRTH